MTSETVGGFGVGAVAEFDHEITREDIRRFVELTGDDNPMHVDPEFAESTSFKGIVAHGMLSASFISTMIGKHIPGPGALWVSQSIQFLLPVRIGDRLRIRATVKGVHPSQQMLTLDTEIRNQHDQAVLTGESRVKLVETAKPPAAERPKAEQPVVLITGASRGIGAATAEELGARGFAVAVGYRGDESAANRVVERIVAAGGRAIAVRGDVASEADARRMVDETVRRLGRLTALVNNAAGPMRIAPFAQVTTEAMQAQLDTHLLGPMRLIRFALPHLAEAANACVVNMGSSAADAVPPVHQTSYVCAKAALVAMTRSLAAEYGPKGIRFNVVSPGMTNTGLIGEMPEKAKMVARMQAPLRRLAEPNDVAKAIAFLLSDEARHITGETLRVNGGAVME